MILQVSKKFCWQASVNETVHHVTELQIPRLEDLRCSEVGVNSMVSLGFLEFLHRDKGLLFPPRVSSDELSFAAYVNKSWLLVHVILKLGHELGKLILYCHIGGNAMDLYGIQLGSQHLFLVWIKMGVGLPGCLDLPMAQAPRYHQDIKSHLNQKGGVGMPKSWKLNRPLYCTILWFIEINYGIALPLFAIICYN